MKMLKLLSAIIMVCLMAIPAWTASNPFMSPQLHGLSYLPGASVANDDELLIWDTSSESLKNILASQLPALPQLSGTYQPLDADLTSLSTGISGIVKGLGNGVGYASAAAFGTTGYFFCDAAGVCSFTTTANLFSQSAVDATFKSLSVGTTDSTGVVAVAGSANIITAGSSVNATVPVADFALLGPGYTIVANGVTRYIKSVTAPATITFWTAVDWQNGVTGYSYTYQKPIEIHRISTGAMIHFRAPDTTEVWCTSAGVVEVWRDPAGQVGIGKIPASILDVQAASSVLRIDSKTAGNTSYAVFSNPSYGTYVGQEGSVADGMFAGTTAGSSFLGTGYNFPIHFATNNAVKMTILGNGNTGINVAAPAHKLEVLGNIRGGIPIVTKSTGVTLTELECNDIVRVTAAVTTKLPATSTLVVGEWVTLFSTGANVIRVNPDDADSIILNGVSGTAGVDIYSSGAIGDSVTLVYTTANTWMVLGRCGTWAIGS